MGNWDPITTVTLAAAGLAGFNVTPTDATNANELAQVDLQTRKLVHA